MATDTTNGGSAKKKSPSKRAAKAASELPPVPTSAAADADLAKKSPRKRVATKKTAAETAAIPQPKVVTSTPAPAAPAATVSNAAKPASSPKPETSVLVKADAGFGNAFYLRGTGPGLSWDKGVAMQCVSSDEWLWSTADAVSPFEVKALLNDQAWQLEPNATVTLGEKSVSAPHI